jgi:pimeloyl-ACP methyl ester carboxylesterase
VTGAVPLRRAPNFWYSLRGEDLRAEERDSNECALGAANHRQIGGMSRDASADIGLKMDEADDRAGNKIVAPVHALWGARGTIGPLWDVLATWRAKATSTVTGRSLDCGHFLQEERPEETLEELQRFFATE